MPNFGPPGLPEDTVCTDVPERCCLNGDPLAFQLVGPWTGQSEGKGLHAPGQPLHLWIAQSHDPYWSDLLHSALGGCKEGEVESFRETSSLHDEGKPPTLAAKGSIQVEPRPEIAPSGHWSGHTGLHPIPNVGEWHFP